MNIIYSILAIIIGCLCGAVGVMAGILRSEQNKSDKQLAEQYKQANEVTQSAGQNVVEVKTENEEKKHKVHSGNNLDAANAALDVLRDNKEDK